MLEAASAGNASELNRLLSAGRFADEATADGLTALHQVCIDNRADLVAMLLDAGATIDIRDKECWTPLHAAASAGSLAALQVLLKRGANVVALTLDEQTAHDVAGDSEEDRTDVQNVLQADMLAKGVTDALLDQLRSRRADELRHDVLQCLAAGSDINRPLAGSYVFLNP